MTRNAPSGTTSPGTSCGFCGGVFVCRCFSCSPFWSQLVSFVLGSLALLGVLTAFFWRFIGPPHFPFLLVLGISLGFELALILYHRLLGFLSS